MPTTQKYVRENPTGYICQEALAAGVARGRHEEHLRACQTMHRAIVEIANARFPVIAAYIEERVSKIESFAILHQFIFVLSTAWMAEDILRFQLALDDAQA